MSRRIQKVMTNPIESRIQIWLYENTDIRIEGKLIGFDEYMNLVLDEAEEILMKRNRERKKLGRIMLKGDNISLILDASKLTKKME